MLLNARHGILDHHCVSEVWVDQYRKWVMLDTGNSAERADVGLHFERDGVALCARELQLLYRSHKKEGVQVCFTPERLINQIAPLRRSAPSPKSKPLARLEKTTSQSTKDTKTAWQPAAARFLWKRKPGRNVLMVCGVNHWERVGQPSRVEVEWTPPR